MLDQQGEDTQEYRLTGTSGKRNLTESEGSASEGKRARTEGGVDRVQCRHLLIKHSGSRVRAPATKPTSSNPLKRKAEALNILQGHLAYLKQKFSTSTAAGAGSLDKAADAVCDSSTWNPIVGWRSGSDSREPSLQLDACVCLIRWLWLFCFPFTSRLSLATQESDCSSAKRGGDLGPFGRRQMAPPFEAVSDNHCLVAQG